MEKVNQETVAWQFVPVEPTPEMVHAMALAWQQAVDREDGNECIAEYRAALAAAPAAPQVAQPLTRAEIKNMIPDGDEWKFGVGFDAAIEFARAIELAHGIGQEGGV